MSKLLNNEDSRLMLAAAGSILSALLAVLGTFAASGFLGFVLVAVGFVLTVATISSFPFIVDKADGSSFGVGILFQFILGLLYGGIVFQWWGIAFAVGTLVVYLVSSTVRSSQDGTAG